MIRVVWRGEWRVETVPGIEAELARREMGEKLEAATEELCRVKEEAAAAAAESAAASKES